jgi:hypothetical protein
MNESLSDTEALFHTEGKSFNAALLSVGKTDEFEHLVNSFFRDFPAGNTAEHFEILAADI